MTSGSGGVEEAAAAGGLLVEHSRYGLLRQRLPAGVTTWSQGRVLPWDVHVEKGSELVIDSGATVRFAPSDLSGRGESSRLTELVVKGGLKIAGTPAGPVQLTVDSRSSDSLWYGLVLEADGALEASHLEISQSGFALTGEVSGEGRAHLENATVRRTVHGINMSVFGDLTIDGSTLKEIHGKRAPGFRDRAGAGAQQRHREHRLGGDLAGQQQPAGDLHEDRVVGTARRGGPALRPGGDRGPGAEDRAVEMHGHRQHPARVAARPVGGGGRAPLLRDQRQSQGTGSSAAAWPGWCSRT